MFSHDVFLKAQDDEFIKLLMRFYNAYFKQKVEKIKELCAKLQVYMPDYEQSIVGNTYVLNGKIICGNEV